VSFRVWHHLTGDWLRTTKARRRRYVQAITALITEGQEAAKFSPMLNAQLAARNVLAAVSTVPDWYRPSSIGPGGRGVRVHDGGAPRRQAAAGRRSTAQDRLIHGQLPAARMVRSHTPTGGVRARERFAAHDRPVLRQIGVSSRSERTAGTGP
jgi:hypothetical protein